MHPEDKQTWYIGVASGGVWKTTNAGTTFTPVFQNEGAYSIGHVVIDPKNPNTIWVGTGEANNQRSVGWGDGIYRSDDGGRSWRNMGLKDSQHIGRIVIDPRDSKVVYVAAYGPLWSAGGDRGLYKTTDGGATWNKILNISEHTGISDVIMDPTNPDVLLAIGASAAAPHVDADPRRSRERPPQVDRRRRHVAAHPHRPARRRSRPHRPGVLAGAQRAWSTPRSNRPTNPVAMYASNDTGETWERRANVQAQPMYYKNIHPDPKDADRIYVPSVQSADLR